MKKAREISGDGIIGYNIMVALKEYASHVKAAVKAGADIIISGAGLPTELPELVKGSLTKIAPILKFFIVILLLLFCLYFKYFDIQIISQYLFLSRETSLYSF